MQVPGFKCKCSSQFVYTWFYIDKIMVRTANYRIIIFDVKYGNLFPQLP